MKTLKFATAVVCVFAISLVLIATQIATAQSSTATPELQMPIFVGTRQGTAAPTVTSTRPASSPRSPHGTATRTMTLNPNAGTQNATGSPVFAKGSPGSGGIGSLYAQEIPLSEFRVGNLELSAVDTEQFRFSTPDNWYINNYNSLKLYLEISTTNRNTGLTKTPTLAGALLIVRVDNELAASVAISPDSQSTRTITVPLRLGLLQTRHSHVVQITLDGRDWCLQNFDIHVTVRGDLSFVHLEYQDGYPALDLSYYPQPFFTNAIGAQPDEITLILPANYTSNDLEAAAALAAGLGRLTYNSVHIRVLPAGAVTAAEYHDSNLILIGQLGTNTFIDSLYSHSQLPSKLDSSGHLLVNRTAVATAEGLVQIVANPQNPFKTALVLTSQSPEGLLKAARALAGQPKLLGLSGLVAIVSDVAPQPLTPLTQNTTFAQLGYPDLRLTGRPIANFSDTADIRFTVPAGSVADDGAYVNLQYDLASRLQSEGAVISLTLNGNLLNSLSVGAGNSTSATATGARSLEVPIPSQAIKPGAVNDLKIALSTGAEDVSFQRCELAKPEDAWLLIASSSSLSVPLRQASEQELREPLISQLPAPFDVSADLSDTWFSLPATATNDELTEMVNIASYLGGNTYIGGQFAPKVSLGEPSAQLDTAQYNFIVIGLPNSNPLLASLNYRLPQPFNTSTNELIQSPNGVVYRLPESSNIGVLQILRSPWSNEHVIVVFTGTSSQGEVFAANILLNGQYSPSDFNGNIVISNPPAVSAVNVDTSASASEAVVTTTSTATTTPTPRPIATVTPLPTITPLPTEINW